MKISLEMNVNTISKSLHYEIFFTIVFSYCIQLTKSDKNINKMLKFITVFRLIHMLRWEGLFYFYFANNKAPLNDHKHELRQHCFKSRHFEIRSNKCSTINKYSQNFSYHRIIKKYEEQKINIRRLRLL